MEKLTPGTVIRDGNGKLYSVARVAEEDVALVEMAISQVGTKVLDLGTLEYFVVHKANANDPVPVTSPALDAAVKDARARRKLFEYQVEAKAQARAAKRKKKKKVKEKDDGNKGDRAL